MSLTVKAFLQKDGKWDGEIRRFQIPADVSSSYDYLSKKLVDIFPSLRQGNFSLFWKDPDGDHVAFSTDEELLEALGFVSDSILKVFIVLKDGGQQSGPSNQGDSEAVHHGVVCDGCEMGPICGPRYKCMVCPDYDLCKNCEGQGIHVEHDMVKMTAPGSFPGFPFGGHGGPFGHGPHGPGPQGPGPHGPFVPPPHFRRWMQRFMKRWHNRNAPGWEGGANGEDSEEKKPADKKAKMDDESGESSGEEYLRNVGETVAEMLDPFGIDVDIEVERHGKENKENKEGDDDKDDEKKGKCGRGRGRCRGGPNGRRGRSAPHCGPYGPYGMWGWMGGCPMGQGGQWGQGGRCGKKAGPQCPMKGRPGQTENKPAETCPQQGPSNASSGMNNMEPPKRAESPVRMDTDPSVKKPDDSWMLLNMNEAPPQPQQQQPPEVPNSSVNGPSAPQVPIYPPADPKIAEALKQMMAMGFNNEGGWLTSLLEAKGGDIIQVLDAIRPQQRSRTNENGTMA